MTAAVNAICSHSQGVRCQHFPRNEKIRFNDRRNPQCGYAAQTLTGTPPHTYRTKRTRLPLRLLLLTLP